MRQKYNKVKKYLTKEKLYYHLVVQNLTQKQLACQCGVNQKLIGDMVKKYKLNKKEERKKYLEELKTNKRKNNVI